MGDALSPHSLAEGLRIAVDRAGLTHEEVARSAGLGVSTLRNYLVKGKDARIPSAEVLRRITLVLARELGEEANDLWTTFGALLDEAPYGPDPGLIVEARRRVRRRK